MDSEALNQVFQTAKAQTFALFNEALSSNEEVVERNILLEEHVEELEQHNSLCLEEVIAEKLSQIPME